MPPPVKSIADTAADNPIIQNATEQRIIVLATKANLTGPEQTEAIQILLGRAADRITKTRKPPPSHP